MVYIYTLTKLLKLSQVYLQNNNTSLDKTLHVATQRDLHAWLHARHPQNLETVTVVKLVPF